MRSNKMLQVKLTILKVVVKSYHECSFAVSVEGKYIVKTIVISSDSINTILLMIFMSFCFSTERKSNLSRRLSSEIELTEKSLFDYVRLPKKNNRTIFSFGFVRMATPG